ncbi:MAG: Hsp20/alpha crystallin family protein [Bacillota bacterium]
MEKTNEIVKLQGDSSWENALNNESWIAPIADIYETENDYYLTAYMPGVSRENIKIRLEDGSLVIMGRINYREIQSRKYILKESESGNYFRRFRISENVDIEKIEASFDNGQLEMKLGKLDRFKPRIISIK